MGFFRSLILWLRGLYEAPDDRLPGTDLVRLPEGTYLWRPDPSLVEGCTDPRRLEAYNRACDYFDAHRADGTIVRSDKYARATSRIYVDYISEMFGQSESERHGEDMSNLETIFFQACRTGEYPHLERSGGHLSLGGGSPKSIAQGTHQSLGPPQGLKAIRSR